MVHEDEPPFQTLKNFMMSLIPLLLATLSGNHLAYSIMELSLHTRYHHGCKQNMTSGFETPKLLSIKCCQTPILNLILIMFPLKSTVLMESIVFETSCLQSGPGSRQ